MSEPFDPNQQPGTDLQPDAGHQPAAEPVAWDAQPAASEPALAPGEPAPGEPAPAASEPAPSAGEPDPPAASRNRPARPRRKAAAAEPEAPAPKPEQATPKRKAAAQPAASAAPTRRGKGSAAPALIGNGHGLVSSGETIEVTVTQPPPADASGKKKAASGPAPTGSWDAPPAARASTSAPPAPDRPSTAVGSAFASRVAEVAYELEVDVRNNANQQVGSTARVGEIAAGALRMIGENIERMAPPQLRTILEMFQGANLQDYMDPDFWKGIWMVVEYQIKEQIDFVQRRLRGDYYIDPYGMDRELIDLVRPFMTFMYRTWWRTQSIGLDNVPAEGRSLLVANHSGVLPWDGAMIATAVAEDHPSGNVRIVRNLYHTWFTTLPFVSPALAAMGQVPGSPENAVRLLNDDQLVCVFPEGLKGVGKLYKDRYKLARFGRGGFVQAALRTGSPIIPVAIVGAEEIYPMLANAEPVARLLGLPYFPITPFFPWLGPLGAIPLPTRWSITFCPPVDTSEYGPEAADDPLVIFMLSEQVRNTIQETLNANLATRTSIF